LIEKGSPGRQRANKRRRKVVWLSPGVLLDFAFYLFARERDGGERFENGIGFVLRLFDSFLDGGSGFAMAGGFSPYLVHVFRSQPHESKDTAVGKPTYRAGSLSLLESVQTFVKGL
jgi:hypothetical protein